MIDRDNRDTLTYRGNRVLFDGNHLVGPDFGDGWLKPVEAEYHTETDTTTIRFESLRKQLWPKEAVLISMQNIQKRQVLELIEAKAGSRRAINLIVWEGNDGPPKVVDTQTKPSVGDDAKQDKRVSRNAFGRKRRNRKH